MGALKWGCKRIWTLKIGYYRKRGKGEVTTKSLPKGEKTMDAVYI